MELVTLREDVVRGPCVQDQILPLVRCRQRLNAAREDCHPKMTLSNPSSEVERSFSQALHACKIRPSDLACSILPHHGGGLMLMPMRASHVGHIMDGRLIMFMVEILQGTKP